ncbi:hypothetical protein KPL71_023864 [Citrus sinensis]|uniref:Uncharacterized protein n=1 Tax=Citrus sinensis TaxID=2711 RepID=A0ACB8INZ0_CITSI|nr:hypothetical protein KPL71_023864 [Citrus sinensis]
MAYEWKTFPHPFPLNHDPTIISTLKAYLLELNNIQPVPANIHHTSIEPRYVLQDPAPVLMEFLFVNNDLTTLMFSSKMPKILGKTSNPYCQYKKLSTLSLNQISLNSIIASHGYRVIWESWFFQLSINDRGLVLSKVSETTSFSGGIVINGFCFFGFYISGIMGISARNQNLRTTALNIENLVEYSYIPESAQINESQFPVMSPYHLYKQKTSFTRSIKTLISTKRPLPKEYIQSSRLDQCAFQASQREQYVTMDIPTDLVTSWKREGYTHLHLGGVRLILTLHGRKGLPVTARIALLDTRRSQPSNNIESPNPASRSRTNIYFQNSHTPSSNSHFHQNSEPIQTTEATFDRRPNDQVKLSFQTPDTKPVSDSPQLSYTAMITAVQTGQEKKLLIHGFSSEGYPVYPDKINGHFIWDVPEAHMCNPDCPCLDDTDIDEELEVMRRKKKKKKKSSCKFFSPHPPPDPKPPVHPIGSCLISKSKVKISKPPPKEDLQVPEDSPKATPEPPKKDKAPAYQYHYQQIDYQNSDSDSTSEENISGLLMATKIEDPSTSTPVVDTPIVEESSDDDDNDNVQGSQTELAPSVPPVFEKSSKPSSSPWFTFDDIPRHKWQARHQEFAAWIDVQMTSPNAQSQNILPNVSLGKIFQLTMLCLDKICEQKDFFKDLIEHKEPFVSACKKPYLKIQCKDDKKCTCPTTKKKHFQKHFHRPSSKKPKKPYRYFRKKDPSQFRQKKYNRCFICKKRVHFAHNCPNKSAKVVRLIQYLQQSSILSDNEEKDDHTAFILADSTDSDLYDLSVISIIQEINHNRPALPGPSVKISVILSKFHKPVSVIGFLDTGTQRSMLNLKILPPDYWDNYTEYFRAANGKVFETSLITKKPIGIQFFPNCIIWQKIIGSNLPDKDLLIRFDILQLPSHLFHSKFPLPANAFFRQMLVITFGVLSSWKRSVTQSPIALMQVDSSKIQKRIITSFVRKFLR